MNICPECGHDISDHDDEGCWHVTTLDDFCDCALTQGEVALKVLEAQSNE